jgi:carboxypeptidase C (cathepsin A)
MLLSLLVGASVAFDDTVTSLPTYGKLSQRHYAGFANATADGKNRLHYWFAESDRGSADPSVPFLVWLNGGPGASSLTGLLAENLGPVQIQPNATLRPNPERPTRAFHLLTVDNPVGAGYSKTADAAYVRSEAEVRTQFLAVLRVFFARHPEYRANPFWVTGESYAGHYVPNVALAIAANASEIDLRGVVIGNGMFNMAVQYRDLGRLAFANGVIDERGVAEMDARQATCLAAIEATPAVAGEVCENATVRWLFSDAPGAAGALFYYDVGLTDAAWFDDLTAAMGKYLNRPDVRAALHAGDASWVQADETGPVADALLRDWTVRSDLVLEQLLERGLKVYLYNGVRDLSSCNHIGNLAVARGLRWSGQDDFAAAPNAPWPSRTQVHAHLRGTGRLQYATLLRTGHLVPTVIPDVFEQLLHQWLL